MILCFLATLPGMGKDTTLIYGQRDALKFTEQDATLRHPLLHTLHACHARCLYSELL
jgi:hypothetical protein